jgi:hypothetical protein
MNKSTTTSQDAKTNKPKLSGAALKAQQKAKRDKRIALAWMLAMGLMTLALASIGFLGSFQHLRDLGVMAGQRADVAWGTANLTPVSVDLMLVIASIQLRRKGITDIARIIARLCSFGGLLISLVGNVLIAWLELPEGSSAFRVTYTLIYSALPVLSLLGAVEMLTHTHRDRHVVSKAVASKAKARKASAPSAARRSQATSANAVTVSA